MDTRDQEHLEVAAKETDLKAQVTLFDVYDGGYVEDKGFVSYGSEIGSIRAHI